MKLGYRLLSIVILQFMIPGCTAPTETPDPALQGKWEGNFHSETEVGVNGVPCTDGAGAFSIEGTQLSGVARNDYDQVYDLVGVQIADGSIKGEFRFRGNISLGTFEGKLSDGELRGTFVDTELCRGTWRAVSAS